MLQATPKRRTGKLLRPGALKSRLNVLCGISSLISRSSFWDTWMESFADKEVAKLVSRTETPPVQTTRNRAMIQNQSGPTYLRARAIRTRPYLGPALNSNPKGEHHACSVDRMGRRHLLAVSAPCLSWHPDPL